MSTPDTIGQAQGSVLHDETGKLTEGRKVYGGAALPPGAVPVTERVLARYVQPGTRAEPHGVPPIGIIGLPAGWVIEDLCDESVESIHVLPFRFPWYSRAYALRCDDRMCAVLRNVQPTELRSGNQVVVQLNEEFDWTAIFGKVDRLSMLSIKLESPDGRARDIGHEHIHFVGKVVGWWDSEAEAEALPDAV